MNRDSRWRDAKLEDLVFFQRGFDITQTQQRPGAYPVISSSGVTSYHDEYKATGPGVVIGRKGTVGSIHYAPSDYWPHDTTLWSKDLKGNNPRFVYFFLRTLDLTRFDVGNSNPTLNRNHIHDLPIRIPPRPIQDRIADVLSAYDDLIENNRRRMVLLEESARLLYQEWFVRLRFPGHERTRVVDGLPEGWEKRPLGRCAKFLSGGTPSKRHAEYWEGEIPWLSSGEMTEIRVSDSQHRITDEGVEKGSHLIPPNTILAVVRGMSLARELRMALTTRPVAFNQDLKALVCEPEVDSIYLFHAMLVQRDQIRDRSTEASHGTKKLDTAVLASVPICLPPSALQKMFRGAVDPLNAQWDNIYQQNERLRAARDLLLPRLMSGEIEM